MKAFISIDDGAYPTFNLTQDKVAGVEVQTTRVQLAKWKAAAREYARVQAEMQAAVDVYQPSERPSVAASKRDAPDASTLLRCNDSAGIGRALRELGRLKQIELDWLKGHCEFATKQDLHRLETRMAKSNAELVQEVKDQGTTIAKVEAETAALIEKVRVLTEAAGNQQNPSQELTDAVAEVTAQLKIHDDQVADA